MKQKGFVPLVFILIIGVLSVAIVGGNFYIRSTSKDKSWTYKQSSSINSPKETTINESYTPELKKKIGTSTKTIDGWKIYKNPSLGVEFQYPLDGYIEGENSSSVVLRLPYRPKGQVLDIQIWFIKNNIVYYPSYQKYGECNENDEYYQMYKIYKEFCWEKIVIDGVDVESLVGEYFYYIPSLKLEIKPDSNIYRRKEDLEKIINSVTFLK
ncbi:hypothetical protein HYT74_04025 [Candidatus Daviesbacteria bacterium]|nr:hypothetical protein [Candidatus Daviesbacteria bacterium]MBI4038824.1 hypothetical protein [Candidatus Daviesbacteria bacterium]